MKKLNFKPTGERVLVAKPKKEEGKDKVTKFGIIIPDISVDLDFDDVSTILAVGEDVTSLKEGQKIKFENPHPLRHDGEDYYLVHVRNVLLIIED